VDLSALYLDVLKDRLYSELPDSRLRRSAQAALHSILSTLVRLVAPILVHTADEVWQAAGMNSETPSVHLARFPQADESLVDDNLLQRFDRLIDLREEVYRHIEEARQSGSIGKPMEARVTVSAGEDGALLNEDRKLLASLFIVSDVQLLPGSNGREVKVEPAPGTRCPRCWLVREDVGSRAERPELCGRCADVVSALSGGEEA
ncbi:MAG: class I tRNA ligase family protein, partial [Armatimonadota bacterium]